MPAPMPRLLILILPPALGVLWLAAAVPGEPAHATEPAARAALPARDLVVEVREIEPAGSGYVVATRPARALLPPQQLRLRNGGEARLAYGHQVAFQWVQAAQAGSVLSGAAVRQGQTWLQAGQRLQLRVRWAGGAQPAVVDIERLAADIQPEAGAAAPAQQRAELLTTVQAPLGQWVTLARTGAQPAQGSYRSDAASERPRELQLRVTLP
jgi:hypothetical protein